MKCNVPKRGWINGVGGCPNVGGICIGCTMPGFPDKFMPFMDEPPGGKLSTTAVGLYGTAIRNLRKITERTAGQGAALAAPRPRAHHRRDPHLVDRTRAAPAHPVGSATPCRSERQRP